MTRFSVGYFEVTTLGSGSSRAFEDRLEQTILSSVVHYD